MPGFNVGRSAAGKFTVSLHGRVIAVVSKHGVILFIVIVGIIVIVSVSGPYNRTGASENPLRIAFFSDLQHKRQRRMYHSRIGIPAHFVSPGPFND